MRSTQCSSLRYLDVAPQATLGVAYTTLSFDRFLLESSLLACNSPHKNRIGHGRSIPRIVTT